MRKSKEQAEPVHDANEHQHGKPEHFHPARWNIEAILADRAQRRLLA